MDGKTGFDPFDAIEAELSGESNAFSQAESHVNRRKSLCRMNIK